ncbi:hypothetical protein H2201_008212 [Coniosporium apollinis]|uniref:Uncharacterized protein n=1 Tax=Coniosporium apollinis TaxID=61459 RepID=A0ABQ9NNF8_9PEZI|nr:hypothetical protein H2201_008212 [Coniosporium apollinis]
MLISQLFWEQSEPWKALALAHIDRMGAACSQLVEFILQKVTTPEVQSRLLSLRVEMRKILQKKYSGDLMRLTGSVQVRLHDKNFLPRPGYSITEYIDPQKLEVNMKDQIEQDMDEFSAEEALDCQTAYYELTLRFNTHSHFPNALEFTDATCRKN